MDIKNIIKSIVEKKLEKDSDDPCWDGYVKLGTKMKDGKEVPNCVPKESIELDESQNVLIAKYVNKFGGNTYYFEIWKKLPSGDLYHTLSNQHGINISASNIALKGSHDDARKEVQKVVRHYDQSGDKGALRHLNHLLPGWKKAPLDEAIQIKRGRNKGKWRHSYSKSGEAWDTEAEADKEYDKNRKSASKDKVQLSRLKPMESVDLYERVEVSHDRYLRSHGKKARDPGYSLNWMFTSKDMGDPKEDEVVSVQGKLRDAAKEAAKKLGTKRVYVMESVDDDFMRDQGGSGSSAPRGTVKKIKGSNNWWAKNKAGTMKIFNSEQKAKKFAMTEESVELDEILAKDYSGMLGSFKKAVEKAEHDLKESVELTEDVHNNLNDAIIEFQKKLMRMTRQLDPTIAKEIKKIDKDLDDLRTGPLFKIRPGDNL